MLDFDLRGIRLRYDAKRERLSVSDACGVYWPLDRNRLSLLMYLDVDCLEIFSEDGLKCWAYPRARAVLGRGAISVRTAGTVRKASFAAYPLKSALTSALGQSPQLKR